MPPPVPARKSTYVGLLCFAEVTFSIPWADRGDKVPPISGQTAGYPQRLGEREGERERERQNPAQCAFTGVGRRQMGPAARAASTAREVKGVSRRPTAARKSL